MSHVDVKSLLVSGPLVVLTGCHKLEQAWTALAYCQDWSQWIRADLGDSHCTFAV